MTPSSESSTSAWWKNILGAVGLTAMGFVRRCPGAPIFLLADKKVVRKALAEFAVVTVASLTPLLVIVLTNSLSSPEATVSGAFATYTKAGEVLFFVGPIVGASFFLLATEFRRSLNGPRFLSERVWFMLYALLALIVSAVMLVVHHLSVVKAMDTLRYVSYVIYAVSLYFSFLQFVYGNFEGGASVAPASADRRMAAELQGFDGEHA